MTKIINKSLLLKVVIILCLTVILAISTVGFRFYNEYRNMKEIVEVDTIYDNIYINGINLGGYTKEEAYIMIEEHVLNTAKNKTIKLVNGDNTYEYSFDHFGINADIETAIEHAYEQARNGTIRERFEEINNLKENPYEIDIEFNFDIDNIQDVIRPLEENVYTSPVNAIMTRNNNQFTVIEGTNGYKMNLIETSQGIYDLLMLDSEGEVNIVLDTILPDYDGDVFRQSQNILGSYSSNFTPGENGRNINIRNASSKINGYILYPGETFSTNDVFGAMTYENGYRDSIIILNGEFVEGMGGGICQVSSNLYMAALYSELQINQRQNHSRRVGYVPAAFDATLATGLIDLVFTNNTDYPIFIESIVTSNSNTVNIYGHETRPSNRSITFESSFVENVPPSEEIVREDASLPSGTRVVDIVERPGERYHLYKVIMENGVVTGRERINVSTYRPITGVVRVGTQEVEPEIID